MLLSKPKIHISPQFSSQAEKVPLSSYVDHPLHFEKFMFQEETFRSPSHHKQICIFLLLRFNLTSLHQDFHYFCQANANQILIHASLNDIFHVFTC